MSGDTSAGLSLLESIERNIDRHHHSQQMLMTATPGQSQRLSGQESFHGDVSRGSGNGTRYGGPTGSPSGARYSGVASGGAPPSGMRYSGNESVPARYTSPARYEDDPNVSFNSHMSAMPRETTNDVLERLESARQVKNQLSHVSDELRRIERESEKKDHIISELKTEIGELKEFKTRSLQILSRIETEASERSDQLNNFMREREGVEGNLRNQFKDVEVQFDDRVRAFKAEHEAQVRDLEDQLHKAVLKAQDSELARHNTALELSMAKESSEARNNEREGAYLDRIRVLEVEIAQLNREKSELREKNEKLQGALERHKEELFILHEHCKTVAKAHEKASNHVQMVERQLQESREMTVDLRRQLDMSLERQQSQARDQMDRVSDLNEVRDLCANETQWKSWSRAKEDVLDNR